MGEQRFSLPADPDNVVLTTPPDSQIIAETLVALANTNGGRLQVVSDQIDSETLTNLLADIAAQCRPPVPICQSADTKADEVTFLVLRSPVLHALPDGRVLGRTLTGNRELNSHEIRQLAQVKMLSDFECIPVPGATLIDLDGGLVHDFIEKQLLPVADTSFLDTLIENGAMTIQGQVTVAGILLFVMEPHRWLPQAGIVLTRYVGTAGNVSRQAWQHIFNGPLARLLDVACAEIVQELPPAAYPVWVIREALENALLHRDYRLHDRVEVKVYDDCLEVITPGKLPGFATLSTLAQQKFKRNRAITHALQAWGVIKTNKSGLTQMHEQMVAADRYPPELYYQNNCLHLKLQHKAPVALPIATTPDISLNWRQKCALSYIQEHGSITQRSFRALVAPTNAETLHRDLSALVEQQLLVKITGTKEAVYVLNPSNAGLLLSGD